MDLAGRSTGAVHLDHGRLARRGQRARMGALSGMLAGSVFLLISAVLFTAWRLAPAHTGIIILVIGMVTSLMYCRWRDVALLSWSLLGTGLTNAVSNNAILYRAVLMTDWLFSLFYLAAFYFSATIIANVVLRVLHRAPDRPLLHASTTADSLILPLGNRTKAILTGVAAVLVLFVVAGSVRLLAVNFGVIAPSRTVSCNLPTSEKREVIERLRGASSAIQQILPDPKVENVEFIRTDPAAYCASGHDRAS